MRHYTWIDQLLIQLNNHLRPITFNASSVASSDASSENPKALSLKLMRINHAGEICAQSLYKGQAWVAQKDTLKKELLKAAEEEQIHLKWCAQRIEELGGKPSILNPLFALGSTIIGMVAGMAGDKISLGFMAETEHQVTAHLEKHLALLPEDDQKSREILLQMREDELRHATNATESGGIPLPTLIRKCMAATAKLMTGTAGYI